jgi:hypothetical protein
MSTIPEALKEYKESLKERTPSLEEAFIAGWSAAVHALLNRPKIFRMKAETR